MSNPTFVDFLRGCKHPKLSWIMSQLELLGVVHRIHGVSAGGPVLQVAEGQVEKAHGVMTTVVGMFNLGGTLTDDSIKVMDLRSDHPFFETQTDIEDLGPEVAAEVTEPIALKRKNVTLEIVPDLPAEDEEEDPFALPDEPPVPALIADQLQSKEGLGLDPAKVDEEVDPDEIPKTVEEIIVDNVGAVAAENYEAPIASRPRGQDVENDDDDPFAEDTPEDDDDGLWDTDDEAEPEHPELDYLRANKVLVANEVQFAGVNDPITMYDVNSSNMSSMGIRITQKDPVNCTFYGRFKGGTDPYRYGPVPVVAWQELLSEAVRAGEGRQDASVGSLFHTLIKAQAEDGKMRCQRLEGGAWKPVLPRKERNKEAVKRTSRG